jgi:hypothetical protein
MYFWVRLDIRSLLSLSTVLPVECPGTQQDRNGFEASYLAISGTRLLQLLYMMFPVSCTSLTNSLLCLVVSYSSLQIIFWPDTKVEIFYILDMCRQTVFSQYCSLGRGGPYRARKGCCHSACWQQD